MGGAAELLGRDQRGDRLHRQPGLDAADGDQPGPAAGRHLLLPCWRWRCSASGRAAASSSWTCAPGPAPVAWASSCSGRCSPPSPAASSPPARSPRAMRPWSSCPSCCWSRWARRRSSTPRSRVVVVGLAVVAGLVSSAQNVTTQRTQAGAVAAAINAQAKPGDVIAFCPDQLGPAVYRQLQDPSQYDMVTFPAAPGRQIVDWVDYANTVGGGHPDAFADTVFQRAGPATTSGWSGSRCTRPTASSARRSPRTSCALGHQGGGGGRNVVTSHQALYYEPMNLTEFVFAAPDRWPSDRAGAAPSRGRPGRRRRVRSARATAPGGCGGACPSRSARRCSPSPWPGSWSLGALGLAHFVVDRTHPATPGVAGPGARRACSAGTPAGTRRSPASATGPWARQSLRFFPAVPLLTHGLAWVPGLGDGPALVLLANAAALAATAMLYVLVRRETGTAAVARRPLWILSLLPAAFVLVMGYAESVLLVLAIGCFLALRPPPAERRPAPLRRGRAARLRGRADPAHRRAPGPGRRGRAGALVAASRARRAGGRHRRGRGALRRPARLRGLVRARRWATGGPRCASSSRARTTAGSRTPSPRSTTTPRGCCTTTWGRPCTCRGCCWPWPCSWCAGAASRAPTRCSPPPCWPPPWPAPTSIPSSATP